MLPLRWWRLHRALRILLGLFAIAAHLAAFGYTITWAVVWYAAYTILGAVALFGKELEGGRRPVAFAIDCGFLFLSIVLSFPNSQWIALALYAYVLASAATQFDAWAAVTTAVLSVVVLNFAQPAGYHILLPAFLSGGILGAVGAAQRQALGERLMGATRQSMLYRHEAEKARESERQRIAADFHDGPLQSFAGFQMRLEIIRKLIPRNAEEAEEEVAELQDLSNTQVEELRSFVRSMRPVEVDYTLNASLRRVIDQFEKDTGIEVSFISAEFVEPGDPDVAIELVQVVREALFNVRKHSGATRVAVAVQKTNRTIEIAIEDNGDGFPFSGKYSLDELEQLRLGPGSIKRRVRSLGGELTVDSKPGQGSGLMVRLQA